MKNFRSQQITEANKYKFSYSFQEGYFGSFATKGNYVDRQLFTLNENEKGLFVDFKLKNGQQIFRVETDRTRLIGTWYYVAMNIEKGLVYFMNEFETGFETLGTQVDYLNHI